MEAHGLGRREVVFRTFGEVETVRVDERCQMSRDTFHGTMPMLGVRFLFRIRFAFTALALFGSI